MKDEFVILYKKKYFNWIDETQREKTKEFFTNGPALGRGYEFDE